MADKYDSNLVGLRFAEEVVGTPKTLPGSPVWWPLEPNSYGDFGATITTVKRDPITSSRQNRKGTVTDLEAMGAFQIDFTQAAPFELMQGFMFADWRKKTELAVTSVTGGNTFNVASGGTGFTATSLLFGSGFANTGNNGLKSVTSSTGTTVVVSGLTNEGSPPSTAKITRVGVQGASGDLTITNSGTPTLGSTSLDLTTLGLMVGEWIFIGGDAAGTQFATAANRGWCRIASIAANAITFDRTQNTLVTDAGTSKTIRIFFGHVLKNESNPSLIKTRTYQLERYLADDTVGYEYIIGSYANTLDINLNLADKITMDLGFMSLDREHQVSAKTGTRPSIVAEEVFNTTSDFARLRLGLQSNAAGMFTYVTELKIKIANGISLNKAIGILGGFASSLGNFMVEGTVEAYFTDDAAVQAVRNNTSMSLDFGVVANNAGWYFDIPHLTLGDGKLKVEKDQPIKLPLNLMAVADTTLDWTMLMVCCRYLPDIAE